MSGLDASWPVAGLAVLAGYLLGSISFSYLIVRMLVGVDVRTVGSGNPGATNVMRVAGRGPGALAFLLDAGKGAAGIALARGLELGIAATTLVGVAAVVGHMWPVFFGFRGGKGVATAAGTLGLLVPLATALSLAIFVVVVWWKRFVSLGSVTVAIGCPLIVAALGAAGRYPTPERWWLTGGCAVIGALIVFKHRANLRRLAAGTESRLGARRLPAGPPAPGVEN
ncbi:MAG TPA: glycerol-3-phosphate 1-O-acyltransferase PlsY [Thermoanaerobaculia bacterium]|nr:glycerol-3-phosphate 1-O-acyltransferase PlsY [Thermoanaerobaculia bacterium]